MGEGGYYTDSHGNRRSLDEPAKARGIDAVTYGNAVRRTWQMLLLAPILFAGLCVGGYLLVTRVTDDATANDAAPEAHVADGAEEPGWFSRTWDRVRKAVGTSVDDEDLDDMLGMKPAPQAPQPSGPPGDLPPAHAPDAHPVAPPTLEARRPSSSPRVERRAAPAPAVDVVREAQADRAEAKRRAEIRRLTRKVEKYEKELREADGAIARSQADITACQRDVAEAQRTYEEAQMQDAAAEERRESARDYRKRHGYTRYAPKIESRPSPRLRARELAGMRDAIAAAEGRLAAAERELRAATDDRREAAADLAEARGALAALQGRAATAANTRRR